MTGTGSTDGGQVWPYEQVERHIWDAEEPGDLIQFIWEMRYEYENAIAAKDEALAALRAENDRQRVTLAHLQAAYDLRGDFLDAAQQRIGELEDENDRLRATYEAAVNWDG